MAMTPQSPLFAVIAAMPVDGLFCRPAKRPCSVLGELSGGVGEGSQSAYQLGAQWGRHLGEDVREGSAAPLGHGSYELPSGWGELQYEIAAIGGVIAAVYEAGADEFVAGAGGVGGVYLECLRDSGEILWSAAGDHHQDAKLR